MEYFKQLLELRSKTGSVSRFTVCFDWHNFLML